MVSPESGNLIELGIFVRDDGDSAKVLQKLKSEYKSLEPAIAKANKATEAQEKALNDVDKSLTKIARKKALEDLARDAVRAQLGAEDLRKALIEIGASESGINQASKAFDRFSVTVKKAADDAEKELRQIDDAIQDIESSAQRASSVDVTPEFDADKFNNAARRRVGAVGDVDTAAQTIGGGLQAAGLGGLGGAVRGAGEVAAVAEGVAQLAGAAPAAIAALGPLAAAIAAIGVAVAIVTDQVRKQNQALSSNIDVIKQFNVDLQTLSTEDAQAQLEAAQAELDGVNQTLFDLNRASVSATQSGNAFERALASTVVRFSAARSSTKELESEQARLQQRVNLLSGGLADQAFAANDAAESTEYVAEALNALNEAAQRTISSIDQQVSINDEIRRASAEFSQEQLDARLREIDLQKRATAERLDALLKEDQAIPAIAKETAQAVDEFNRLREVEARLVQEVQPLVAAREREAQVAGALASALQAGRQKVEQASAQIKASIEKRAAEQERLATTAANAIIKAEDDIKSIRQQSAQRITQIESQLQQKLQDLAQTRNNALADAQRDAADGRADAQQDANTQIEELERDLGQRRKQIEREANQSLAQAAGDRNAVAFREAQERRESELSQLKEEGETRRTEIQQQLEQQTADIARNLARQTETINQNYKQQVSSAQQSARAQIQLEQQKAQQEIALRQKQIQAELNALRTLDTAAQQFAQNMISTARRLGSVRSSIAMQTAGRGASRPAGFSRPRTNSSSSSGNLFQRAANAGGNLLSRFGLADSGAIVESPGLLRVTTGEAVLRPRQLAAMSRGGGAPQFNIPININGMGMSREQVKRLASEQFNRKLNQALSGAI